LLTTSKAREVPVTGAARGEAAITRIGAATTHVRGIDQPLKGTWGAYDLESARELWWRHCGGASATFRPEHASVLPS
jgi:hypothetical protein